MDPLQYWPDLQKSLLICDSRRKTSKLARFLLLVRGCINLDNVWHLFYWLPAREKSWMKAHSVLSKKRYCWWKPSLYGAFSLSASISLARCQNSDADGKQAPSSKTIKNEWGDEPITQPFYACRSQDHCFCCKMPLLNNIISNLTMLQDTNTQGQLTSQQLTSTFPSTFCLNRDN